MLTFAYLAYGRRRLTEATVFSALTLQHAARDLAGPWRLVVYTDAPDLFRRHGVGAELLPVDGLDARGPRTGYPYQRKLDAILDCAERYDGSLLFVDGDTYFTASPEPLRAALAGGAGVLHTYEWALSADTQPALQAALDAGGFASPRLESARLRAGLPMWNSGVVGLPAGGAPLAEEVSAISAELYAASGYHAVEQFAWTLVLEAETGIVAAEDVVAHYWYAREQLTHRVVKALRAGRRLAPSERAAQAFALQPAVTDGWTPPVEVRARRLAGAARRGVKDIVTRATVRPR